MLSEKDQLRGILSSHLFFLFPFLAFFTSIIALFPFQYRQRQTTLHVERAIHGWPNTPVHGRESHKGLIDSRDAFLICSEKEHYPPNT